VKEDACASNLQHRFHRVLETRWVVLHRTAVTTRPQQRTIAETSSGKIAASIPLERQAQRAWLAVRGREILVRNLNKIARGFEASGAK
jgi:hypothetical protein